MPRVAAYCRVSTDKEDQANSLASQQQYFTEYICRQTGWELAEMYVDEGLSGTSTKKRRAFNRMISDAGRHKFELIITKEISRFARNTLDSIYYTRKLKDLGVGVIFLNDNINTLDADAELRLTIMSSIAQEESRKISERVKWGQKRRMEQGVVFGRDMLGYDVREGILYINESGAATVRLIFHKFLNEGKGSHIIARELREAGLPTATHMKQWSNTVILRVLRNEKYCGDLKQKKTFTPSYLNHEKKYNRGEEEFVLLRDHHSAIISREMFEQAQAELARRSPSGQGGGKHSNRYCFSGKIRCGICGRAYVSRSKKRQDGSLYQSWRCYAAASHGSRRTDAAGNITGCDNRSLNDGDLRLALQQLVASLPLNQEAVVGRVCGAVAAALAADERQKDPARLLARIEVLQEKKRSLVELYLNQDISKADFQHFTAKYEAEIAAIEKECQALADDDNLLPGREQLLADMAGDIRGLLQGEAWCDAFCRQLLDKIVVTGPGVADIYLYALPEPWRCSFGVVISAPR